eukprot:595587-Pyramimonas_sp.AAC.1
MGWDSCASANSSCSQHRLDMIPHALRAYMVGSGSSSNLPRQPLQGASSKPASAFSVLSGPQEGPQTAPGRRQNNPMTMEAYSRFRGAQ